MDVLFGVGIAVLLLFGLVVFTGAPYLPTLKRQAEAGLDLLDLEPGQTMLELGCGDGRVLAAAAKRGIRGVGYELNPILVVAAWLRTMPYRRLVKVRWANYWQVGWPPADGIFVFLLDKYMLKLDKKIVQECSNPVKLVSFTFQIPDKKPDAASDGLYLYRYKGQ